MQKIPNVGFIRHNFYILTSALLGAIFISNDAYLPAIPTLSKFFGVPENLAQLGVTYFVLGGMLLLLIMGPISDRIGRRPVLIAGSILFTICNAVIVFSPTIYFFLVVRFIQGIAMTTTIAAAFAAIIEYYDQHNAVRAMSISGNITMIAPAVGPIFGALALSISHSWTSSFIVVGGFSIIVTIILILYMPETLDKGPDRKIIPMKELFSEIPHLIRNRTFMLYSLAGSAVGVGFALWITGATYMFQTKLGLSPTAYAYYQSPVFIMLIIGNTLAPSLQQRFGSFSHMNKVHSWMLFTAIPLITLPLIFRFNYELSIPFNYLWTTFDLKLNLPAMILTLSMCYLSFFMGLVQGVRGNFTITLSKYHGTSTSVMMLISMGGFALGSVLAAKVFNNANNWMIMSTIGIAGTLSATLAFTANRFLSKEEKLSFDKPMEGAPPVH